MTTIPKDFVERLNQMMAAALGQGTGRTYITPHRYIEASRGNLYNYYHDSKRQTMYCWTIKPDNEGDYWSWVYAPFGKGLRTGKARRWKLKRLMSSARRKIAKRRAWTMYTVARGLNGIGQRGGQVLRRSRESGQFLPRLSDEVADVKPARRAP